MNPFLKPLKNERGLLTLDFMFATVIIFGFTGILFSFAMTFSVVEVVQYITYSSARNFTLAHFDESRQQERARQKLDELIANQAIAPLLNNGWFEVRPGIISDFNSEYNPDPSQDSDIFQGVRIPFSAPILFKRIPFLGTTGDDPDSFNANIQSFLAREPNFDECRRFISERGQQMRSLVPGNWDESAVVVMMDNGC
ncbi:MAG: hypothetical protein AAF203_11305 [Pseudomonadota bacterium]